MKKVAIIGGGIIGQFIAHFLSGEKYEVTVIDDNPKMPPPSAGNCGLITPSHIAPLNHPGLIWQGIKWLGKKDAPFSIKPQWSPDFYRWILSFLFHSRTASYKKATETRHQLLKRSWILFEEFIQKNQLNINWRSEGLVFVANTSYGIKSIHEEASVLDDYQLDYQLLSREELLTLEPQLQERVKGGAIFHVDGWLNPVRLLQSLREMNERAGVHFIHAKADSFSKQNGKIDRVLFEAGDMNADEYIVCNGALSARLGKKLGIHLPIIPGKGYHLSTREKLPDQPKRPVYMVERKVVATPWDDGFRLGSTMEFAGFNDELNEHRLSVLKTASNEYLKTKIDEVDFVPWAGWRPMSSTGTPIIERSSKYRNLTFAVGHGMLGLSMAPATGELVAQIINNEM